jgi:hypothetical protein
MPAIITDILKKDLLAEIKADFDSAGSEYYVGLGRSELWDDSDNVVTPTQSDRTINLFRHSLQGIKKIQDVSYVVPRFNWSSGTIYSAYDDSVAGYPTNAYYVRTASNQIYICLQQGRNAQGQAVPSTVEPTSVSTSPITLGDGYTWKYLYTIGAVPASRFLTANFMPVRFVDSAENPNQTLQKSIQDAAIPGQISGIAVVSGGSGYSSGSPPSVTIVGDGDSAQATAIVSGGAIVNVQVTNRGSGYTFASVKFSSGAASARAILAPAGGFGADPRNDLRSSALMFNGRPDGTENGALIIDQDFRQVGLIRDPKIAATDSDFIGNAGSTLNFLSFQGGATPFTNDTFIVGGTSGARAYVTSADSAAGVFYHQSETTGFGTFQSGEALTAQNAAGATVTGAATLDSDIPALINRYSGEVLYIDNRTAVIRSDGELQDIKIVVQL